MAPSRVPPSVLAALGLISMEAACLPDACEPGGALAPIEVGPCLSPVEGAPCLSDVPGPEEPERREPDVGPCLKPLLDGDTAGERLPRPPPKVVPGKEPTQPAACLTEVPPEANPPQPSVRPRLDVPGEPVDDEARLQLPPGEEARAAVLERGVLPADVASLLRGKPRG